MELFDEIIFNFKDPDLYLQQLKLLHSVLDFKDLFDLFKDFSEINKFFFAQRMNFFSSSVESFKIKI